MEEDNIIFETMPDFRDIKLGGDNIQQTYEDEKEYDSLYDELMDKCNPKNFDIKTFGYEKFNEANLIYSQIRNLKSAPETDLITLRNFAMEKLEIHISTKRKYSELEEYLNPDQYVDREDYDAELVSIVGKIYEELLTARYDIRLLEKIEEREIVKKLKEEYTFFKISVDEYLKKYPDGIYSEKVKLKLEQEETECFRNSSSTEYLNKYPNGRYAEEVRLYLKSSREYLKQYPEGRYKEAAEDECSEMRGAIIIVLTVCLIVVIAIMMSL